MLIDKTYFSNHVSVLRPITGMGENDNPLKKFITYIAKHISISNSSINISHDIELVKFGRKIKFGKKWPQTAFGSCYECNCPFFTAFFQSYEFEGKYDLLREL